jgi:hypothetical protein
MIGQTGIIFRGETRIPKVLFQRIEAMKSKPGGKLDSRRLDRDFVQTTSRLLRIAFTANTSVNRAEEVLTAALNRLSLASDSFSRGEPWGKVLEDHSGVMTTERLLKAIEEYRYSVFLGLKEFTGGSVPKGFGVLIRSVTKIEPVTALGTKYIVDASEVDASEK